MNREGYEEKGEEKWMKSHDKANTWLSLGYGVGVIGEGLGYNIFYSFFVYFLVDIAGINAAIAGTISLLAVIWDAITDPIIGYYSDNTTNPKGRRRPLIFKGAFIWCIAIALMFHNVDLDGAAKVAYYIVLNVFFWLAGTMCVIPHSSLGADLSDDYNGRNRIRTFAALGLNTGMLIATGVTLMVVSFFQEISDGTESSGWSYTGMLYGGIVLVAYMITYFATEGKERTNPNINKPYRKIPSLISILKEYGESFTNPPFLKLLLVTFIVNFVVGVASSLNVYMYIQAYGFDDATSSLMYTVNGIGLLIFTVANGMLASKIGKKATMALGLFVYGLAYLVVQVLPLTFATGILNALMVAWGSSAYWTLLYSMCYDCGIVSKLKKGSSQEGLHTSAIGFFMKAGTAIGMCLVGFSLDIIGYDPDLTVQLPETLSNLRILFTLPNGLILVIGMFIMLKYEMNQKAYDTLNSAYQKKLNEEAYNLGQYSNLVK